MDRERHYLALGLEPSVVVQLHWAIEYLLSSQQDEVVTPFAIAAHAVYVICECHAAHQRAERGSIVVQVPA